MTTEFEYGEVVDDEIAAQPTGFTFRDSIRKIVPVWLQRGNAEKILYSIAIQFDALTEMAVGAVKYRMPNVYGNESLPALGKDRRIRRGPSDTDATYAARLEPWLTHHKMRGGPHALLEQVHKYFHPNNFEVDLVYRSGARYHMGVDGTIERVESHCTWESDLEPEKWARWTLYYRWPTPVSDDGMWGDAGAWGDGGLWGTDLDPQVAKDLITVPTEWNNAHCFGSIVLVYGDDLLWGEPAGALWTDPDVVWDTGPRVRLLIS
jgi:hypothetical protein